ncbi:hypothetical protein GNI_174110 [Gregarina niphandrodes]|uniref:Uncharacterized protein n=1 Tax=Gregarina niphandrodes TaxID=110365 RepID=A0A023AY90_GRENI|nr:hypothetical protein GNI_174110 [Gregarina niphandrodes]EZG43393.1 hypothetical protein GNI_174110 [Gregarina niphandrodes]|eukprot:XP_011133377.1 hypothetical protein GNI_174110 [Gregarina niphandrodes]
MSVLESTFTTFAQLRDALVSSYVEQGPSGDYRQQFWVGACRPYLHCDQDELHVSDTTRLLAAQRGARGQSLGKDAVYCTRCVPRVIHDLDGPGYLPLDESDWDSSGLSSTDLGRRTWLNEMRNVKYILRTGAATQVNVWRHTLPWTATCIPKTGALPLSPEGNETILQTIATAIADKRLINLGVMLQYYRLSRKMVKTIRLQIEKLLKLVATQQWEVRKGYSRGVRKAASKGWFIDSYDQVYIMISPPTDILDRKTKTAAFQVVLTRDCLKSHSQEDANKRNEEFFTKLSVDAHSESEPVCQFTHASAACFV